jgi:hypothetical protein
MEPVDVYSTTAGGVIGRDQVLKIECQLAPEKRRVIAKKFARRLFPTPHPSASESNVLDTLAADAGPPKAIKAAAADKIIL